MNIENVSDTARWVAYFRLLSRVICAKKKAEVYRMSGVVQLKRSGT